MNGIAKVSVMGARLTRDPEARQAGERTVTKMGIVVNRSYKPKGQDEWVETAHFFDVTVWGSLGERCAAKLRKGDVVHLEGDLEFESWEAQDGSKRSRVSINARSLFSEGLFRDEGGSTGDTSGGFKDDDIPF